jgi:hypothetical protein
MGRDAIARFPRQAFGRDASYVVGVNIQLFDDHVVTEPPLLIWQRGRGTLPRPTGDFSFLGPRATVEANGQLRLVWGEPDESGVGHIRAREWLVQRVTTLWTATLSMSGEWSAARVIYRDPSLAWPARGSSDNFGGTDPLQAAVVPSRTQSAWLDRTARVHALPAETGYGYLSLHVDSDASYLSYIAAANLDKVRPTVGPDGTLLRSDQNSVFVASSKDAGVTWDPGRLVSLSGENPAYDVQVQVGRLHDVHLVWNQSLHSGASVIRHVVSTDGGVSWGRPDDLPLQGHVENIQTGIDDCGTIHVVYEDWSNGVGDTRLIYARWSGSWSNVEALFPDLVSMTPELRRNQERTPTLAFVARRRADTTRHFTTFVSTWVP